MIERMQKTLPILFLLPALAFLLGGCSTIRKTTTHESFMDGYRSVRDDLNGKQVPPAQAAPKTP
jgi:hypothetical protein